MLLPARSPNPCLPFPALCLPCACLVHTCPPESRYSAESISGNHHRSPHAYCTRPPQTARRIFNRLSKSLAPFQLNTLLILTLYTITLFPVLQPFGADKGTKSHQFDPCRLHHSSCILAYQTSISFAAVKCCSVSPPC